MTSDGQLIHALNVVNFPQGALSKRGGYRAILGNPDGQQVNGLFAFPFQDGETLFTYRQSGTSLYYSTQGTGAWTQANMGTGPGSVVASNYIGNAIFNNILTIGDGSNILWTSGNGTSFTQPGSAPIAQYLQTFHNRLYTTDGTSSLVQYSVANDPTNWQNSGTSDSSFLVTTSAGACEGLFVAGDMLQITKSKGDVFTWDDTTLTDVSTSYGPSSPKSIAQIDNYWFYINYLGIFGDDGANKQLLSAPITRMFFNRLGVNVSGINLINSGNVLATTLFWDYISVVGNINDDFTGKIVNNALIKYDYQKNAFVYWNLADFPTAITSYVDLFNHQQLLFGNSSGQVFQYDQGATSDNGAPIATEMVFLFTYAAQANSFSQTSAQTIFGSSYEKKWNWIRLFFNPGDEMNIQFAFSNTMQLQHLKWSSPRLTRDRGQDNDDWFQVSDGVAEIRFPNDVNNTPRSRFLFLRIYDESDASQWTFYGSQIDAEIQDIK